MRVLGKRQFPVDRESIEGDTDQRLGLFCQHEHRVLVGRDMHGDRLGTGRKLAREGQMVGSNLLNRPVFRGQGVDERPRIERHHLNRRAIERDVARDRQRLQIHRRHGLAFFVSDESVTAESTVLARPATVVQNRGERQRQNGASRKCTDHKTSVVH